MESIYSFGYYVRRRRMALDMTQRELAEAAGCALVTLKKIETDHRRPSPEMAARLAECLALPAAELPAFMAAARGAGPVDTLAAPQPPALFPPRDVVPASPSALIGREAEIASALALLGAPDARLVTLVGPGGIGKTRLALAVAGALQQTRPRLFAAGIVFVDLTAITSAAQVVPALAAVLGFELDTGGRRDTRPPVEQLAGFLRPRDMLLILDNLEQIDGAHRVIDDLLRATTAPKVLATSRERLNLPWEHLLALPGLTYPAGPAPDPAEYPAGRLFLARARRLRPDFVAGPEDHPALAALCALVDGMPLALELSATWIDTLSLSEIAAELRHDLGLPADGRLDLPERHRSLRAVWDSAWARLAPAEQAAFAQLSVFRGGFTRAAAEAVAGVTLGLLGRLTAKYLITLDREAGRYRIHELLRQYGYANLDALGAAGAAHHHHFAHFLALAETLAPQIHGPGQPAALDRLAAETGNLNAALEWGLAHRAGDDTARLMSALHWYWRIRSRMTEASAWLDRALQLPGLSPTAEARLLFGAGHLAWMRGEFALARDRHAAALALWHAAELDDSLEATISLQHLSMSYGQMGDLAAAAPLQAAALARYRELDATWWVTFILPQVARISLELGDVDVAEQAAAEHLRLVARVGDPWLTGLGRINLGGLAWWAGDLPRARRLFEEGLAAQRVTGHTHSVGSALVNLGEVARQEGDEAAAAGYFSEAVALYEAMGHERYAAEARAMLP